MKKIAAFVAIAAVYALVSFGAGAQALNGTDITKLVGAPSGTIGTSSVLVVPQMNGGTTVSGGTAASLYAGVPAAWLTVFIADASSSATISCGYSSAVAANGAGTVTVAPGGSLFWPIGTPFKNLPIYCIASAASTPFQVVLGVP